MVTDAPPDQRAPNSLSICSILLTPFAIPSPAAPHGRSLKVYMYTPASGGVKPYQNTVLRRMENRLVFRRILPLTPRSGSGYNLPSSKKSRACRVPKEECPDENSGIEKTVPAGAATDPRGGQLPRSGVPVGRRDASVRRKGRGGHRDGRGREHLPRLRLLLGADDPRTCPSEDRLRDPQSRGTRDELRGAHGRGGRARPPHPEGIPLDREGPSRLLGDRGGDERRPARPGLYGTGQDREVRGVLPRPRRPDAGQGRFGGAHFRTAGLPGRPERHGEGHPDRRIQRCGFRSSPLRKESRADRRRDRRADPGQHGGGPPGPPL